MILVEEVERKYKIWMPHHKEFNMKKLHKSILIFSMISVSWVVFGNRGRELKDATDDEWVVIQVLGPLHTRAKSRDHDITL